MTASPRWSAPALRPDRDPEPLGGVRVEAPRPRLLDQRVADGVPAVIRSEGLDPVLVAREHVARPERDELVGIGEPPEHAPQVAEQVGEAGRAVDRDRQLPPAKREGLQHPGEAQEVVGVEVREEDLAELDEPDRRAEHLPLRPLRAVEEQALAPTAHEQRARRAVGRRHRAGRAEKDDVEIHQLTRVLRTLRERLRLYGSTMRAPATNGRPVRPFRCSIFQTPPRGSPP